MCAMIKSILYRKQYYWNMYAPHRIIRRFLSSKLYYWADNKYGVIARGYVKDKLNTQQKEMLIKWRYWMDIKIKISNRI